jgi:hypothetical protein
MNVASRFIIHSKQFCAYIPSYPAMYSQPLSINRWVCMQNCWCACDCFVRVHVCLYGCAYPRAGDGVMSVSVWTGRIENKLISQSNISKHINLPIKHIKTYQSPDQTYQNIPISQSNISKIYQSLNQGNEACETLQRLREDMWNSA